MFENIGKGEGISEFGSDKREMAIEGVILVGLRKWWVRRKLVVFIVPGVSCPLQYYTMSVIVQAFILLPNATRFRSYRFNC